MPVSLQTIQYWHSINKNKTKQKMLALSLWREMVDLDKFILAFGWFIFANDIHICQQQCVWSLNGLTQFFVLFELHTLSSSNRGNFFFSYWISIIEHKYRRPSTVWKITPKKKYTYTHKHIELKCDDNLWLCSFNASVIVFRDAVSMGPTDCKRNRTKQSLDANSVFLS